MAFTQAQLDALNEAIAQGVLEVEYADKKVRYRSLEEMRSIRDEMNAQLNPSTRKTYSYPKYRSGWE